MWQSKWVPLDKRSYVIFIFGINVNHCLIRLNIIASIIILAYDRGLSCKPNIYLSWSASELKVRLALWNRFKPSSKIFYWPFQSGTSFVDILMLLFFFCLVFAMPFSCASVYMCLVVTCWERAELLALVCRVLLWVCHFPIGILCQVWYLIVSIPDLYTFIYFNQ